MGDVKRSDPEVLLHQLQLVAQLDAQLRVQIGQGFVQADDSRLVYQSPRDGDALLLAAGKLGNSPFELLFLKLDLLSDRTHLLLHFHLGQLFHLQAKGDVVPHRHRGKQRIALKHDADVPLLYRYTGDVGVAYVDASRNGFHKPGDRAEGCRLATAGGTEKSKEFPFPNIHADIVQRDDFPEANRNPLKSDHHPSLSRSRLQSQGFAWRAFIRARHASRRTCV